MAEAQQEKRATRRFALRLPVAVTYADNGTQEKSAQTRDVSARGRGCPKRKIGRGRGDR